MFAAWENENHTKRELNPNIPTRINIQEESEGMYFHMKSYSVNQLPVYNATSSNLGEKKTHFPEAGESNADKAFRQWLFPVLKSQLTLIT